MSKRKFDLVQTIKEKAQASSDVEMSFFDHLEVLRWHLIRSAIAVVLFTCVGWTYYDYIFNEIILGPKKASFWTYRMMCELNSMFHLGPEFCITKDAPFTLLNTEMAGQFTLQMNSSLMIGVMLGFPYLLYELWRFIKPGLKETEVKSASGFVFYASILFVLGVMFGYYIISPLSVSFLARYVVSAEIQNSITIDSYLSTVATLTLGTGVVFELPIVIYILSRMGIMTPKFMRSSRRYSTVLILIIAAVVTPTPDITTMLTVSFPLFLLYEVSIMVSERVEKRRKKAEEDFYSGA
ncbi:MAG TPA: twin-arginine translocase subunit TatC [Sphingobacteriaceae bacterium]|nr:twin-arginine translocase subunit TatC [Sphingobacteriaceae bacterium]